MDDRKFKLASLLNYKIFGQTYPITVSLIIAAYAMFDTEDKRTMLLGYLKYAFGEILSKPSKDEDYEKKFSLIAKLNDKIDDFLANLTNDKTDDQIEARIKEADLSKLYKILEDGKTIRIQNSFYEKNTWIGGW